MNLMFSVEQKGQSHETGNGNSELGVEGAHLTRFSGPKKLGSESKAHQSIEMETKTPLFYDPRTDESPIIESSLSPKTGIQTPGMGLESTLRFEIETQSPQSVETTVSSTHSPGIQTESQYRVQMGTSLRRPHSSEMGTVSQHDQSKSPHKSAAAVRIQSPHSPEIETESCHGESKSPCRSEVGAQSPHSPEVVAEGQHGLQMGSKGPHSPQLETEDQHGLGMGTKSPHSSEMGTVYQHDQSKNPRKSEVGIQSPHSPQLEAGDQHGLGMGTKSPHSSEMGTEGQQSQLSSPHSPEIGTESHRGFGLGTKRLHSYKMGTEGQHGLRMGLEDPHNLELEAENQHGLKIGAKGPHNLEMGTGQHELRMGTNSSRESGIESESQHDQVKSPYRSEVEIQSPHRSKMGTENQHRPRMRMKSPKRCEIEHETEAHSPHRPEMGTGSQHDLGIHCMRSVLPTDQTELQMLQGLCSTIQTMRLKNFGNLAKLCGIQHEPKPRICLIGTFKDEISESSLPEARSKIEAAFKEYLESRNLSRSVIKDKKNLFFLLNALEGMEDPEHAEYINNLRKSLSKSESAIKIRIPLMWYQLREITVRVSPHFVKYRLLKSFAIRNSFCSNSSDQSQSFHTFVRLFHLLGFYAYFDLLDTPDDHNWICTDATIFYQQVSKLLAVQFIPDKDLKPSTENFKRTGLLVHHTEANDSESDDFVEDLHLDTTMDLDWFFSVLCHLGIAAKLKQSGKQLQRDFFIPAALPERDGSIHTFPTSVPPICISLKLQDSIASQHHYTLPQGIFAQVAVKFLNTLEGCKPCTADKNFRGSIKLRCNKYNALIQLTEFASHIKVAVQVQEPFHQENSLTNGVEQLHKFCSQVRTLIKSVTDDVCARQYPGIAHKDESEVIYGFSCCCEKAATELHLAEVCHFEEDGESTVSMVCIKKGMQEQFQLLSAEQLLWFTPPTPENMEITLRSQEEEGQTLKYWILSRKQSSSVGSGYPMSKLYEDTLVETLPDVRCNISLDDLLPRLEVPRGFMTRAERNLVTPNLAEQEKVDKIFEILRKKSDQDVDRFIAILNESGNKLCARILQDKLDTKKKFKEIPNRSGHQSVSTSQVQGSPLSPPKAPPHSHSLPSISIITHHDDGMVHFSPF